MGPLALDVLKLATAHQNAEIRSRVARLIDHLEAATVAAQAVSAAAFSPDGKTLAAVTEDLEVKLWEVATGKEQTTLKGRMTADAWCAVFSPDGKWLATGNADGTINLWDVTTGKQRASFKGHTESVYALAYSADGKVMASGSKDKTIKLWDVAKPK